MRDDPGYQKEQNKIKGIFAQGLSFEMLILILAIGAGIAVRINYISGSVYPINDGGLFYSMIEDLVNGNFALPEYTTYNHLDIPYAYPPLGLYAAGFVYANTTLSLLSIVKWLPAIMSFAVLIGFYFLAREILKDSILSSLAFLFFALLPRSYEWFMMGGGVTRSFGFLFLVLSMLMVWRIFAGDARLWTRILAMVSAGFTVLSHPEAGLYLVFTTLAFFVYHGITKENFLAMVLVGAGAAVIVLPWWLTVIKYHGLEPFLAAGGTGHANWFRIRYLITLNFDLENPYFLTLAGTMALLGFFIRRSKESWLFAFLVILGYVIYPRGGVNYLVIPISFLASLGLDHFLAVLDNQTPGKGPPPNSIGSSVLSAPWSKVFFGFIFIYLFLGSYTIKYASGHQQIGLSNDKFEAIRWLDQEAEEKDHLLVYPNHHEYQYWWNDYLAEWVPALTELKSVTTVQGYEWLPGLFYDRIQAYYDLRSCQQTGPECVERWVGANQEAVDYVLISEVSVRPNLAKSFELDQNYLLVYTGFDLKIFERK